MISSNQYAIRWPLNGDRSHECKAASQLQTFSFSLKMYILFFLLFQINWNNCNVCETYKIQQLVSYTIFLHQLIIFIKGAHTMKLRVQLAMDNIIPIPFTKKSSGTIIQLQNKQAYSPFRAWRQTHTQDIDFSAVQCIAVQCRAVQCNAVQYRLVQGSAMQCNSLIFS